MSLALAGGFLTTAPPGKSQLIFFKVDRDEGGQGVTVSRERALVLLCARVCMSRVFFQGGTWWFSPCLKYLLPKCMLWFSIESGKGAIKKSSFKKLTK